METFYVDNLDGSQTEWVKLENPDGSSYWMTKAHWDSQQAAKEAQSLTSPNTDPTA